MIGLLMRSAAVALALSCVVHPALAEVKPRSGPQDGRIRYVTYSANDVIVIEASYGASTMIMFQEDEQIETLGAGDALAWSIEPNKKGNVLFVKPIEKDTIANLNVLTNKRSYVLLLRAGFRPVANQIYKVSFRYPEDEANQAMMAEAIERASQPNRANFNAANANSAYGYKGSSVNKPIAIFDDGVKTFFRFRKGGEVPGIFIVDEDRNESLVNFRREGEYIVVDKVNFQWTLRNGQEITCVFNLRDNDVYEPTGFENNAPRPLAKKKPILTSSNGDGR